MKWRPRLRRRAHAHHEENLRLILLAAGPTLWALHFLVSYTTAAVWCAKAPSADVSLGPARVAIAIYTVAALIGIGYVSFRGLRLLHVGDERLAPPHGDDSAADRDRFLGFATLLLCGLSVVGVVYAALAAVFIGSCR